MKLAEAILEKQRLERQSELLKSRLKDDVHQGRPTARIQEELQRTVNQARDISIAVDWTEQNTSLSGIPLGAYRNRIKYSKYLAKVFENINQEVASSYWDSAYYDIKIVNATTWLVDLKVPGGDEKKESL